MFVCNRKKAFVISNFLAILYGLYWTSWRVPSKIRYFSGGEKTTKKIFFICFPLLISLSQTYCTLIQIGLSRRLRAANENGPSSTVQREEKKKWKGKPKTIHASRGTRGKNGLKKRRFVHRLVTLKNLT